VLLLLKTLPLLLLILPLLLLTLLLLILLLLLLLLLTLLLWCACTSAIALMKLAAVWGFRHCNRQGLATAKTQRKLKRRH
jgi:hypothetical protein